ncbi:MAG: LacI family DNA-binding transcriptional regulator [Lachnospiraceae bacterium]
MDFIISLNELEDIDKDFDYQFNTIYDYQDFADIDALIIEYGSLGMFLNEAEQKDFLRKFGDIPRVILEERYQSTRATAIITDNYHGMYSIAEHLIRDHGYRDITYLAGPKGNTDAEEREKSGSGCHAALRHSFWRRSILYGNFSSNVQKQVNELLDRFPHMEAMICANDNMADTAYKECLKRGLTVGRDIAITGYDDWELAGIMDPPLTTVLQNANDMGYMAVIGALELCRGRRSYTVVVPARLKIRESCGCCKKKLLASEPGSVDKTDWHVRSEEKIKEILKEVFSETTQPELKSRLPAVCRSCCVQISAFRRVKKR